MMSKVSDYITTILASRQTIINMDGRTITPTVSGALTPTDFSATCTGCTRVNGVLTFDGVDDYVQLPAAAIESAGWDDATGAVIVEFTPTLTSLSGTAHIFALGANGNNMVTMYQDSSTTQVKLRCRAGGTSEIVICSIAVGTTYRAGIMWTGGNVRFYFDGVDQGGPQVIGGTWSGTLVDANTVLGAWGNGPLGMWQGSVSAFVPTVGYAPSDANMQTLTNQSNILTTAFLDTNIDSGKWLHYK